MINLEGVVINVFTQKGGTDKKTGNAFEDRDKVQLMGALELPNGDIKHELVNLTVENGRDYEQLKNKKISIPCGALASGRNVVFMLLKAQRLELSLKKYIHKKQQLTK